MSQFEFISVAVSLVLALGVTRLLEGLPILAQSKNRCWVHWFWCVQIGTNFAMTWWIFWNYREVDNWNLLKFLLVLVYPAMSFVVAAILIPKDAKSNTDWHDYFYKIRPTLFGTLGFAMAAQAIVVTVVTGANIFSQATYLITAFVIIYLIGFYTKNPKAHAIIVCVHALMMCLVLAPLAFYEFNIPAN